MLCRLSYVGEPDSSANLKPASRTGAGNGTRTRDPELGRLALYQLSYSRSPNIDLGIIHKDLAGGEGRIRTSEGISRQIYSLLPLAAREPLQTRARSVQADGQNRTGNLLITSQLLYL